MTEGMVIVESVPPIGGGGDPASSFTITTPLAPAACAFRTLATKLHVRWARSSSTIPDSGEPNALQPSVDPALSTGAVKVPATPVLVSGGPNSASPTRYSRARLGGEVTVSVGVPATK